MYINYSLFSIFSNENYNLIRLYLNYNSVTFNNIILTIRNK